MGEATTWPSGTCSCSGDASAAGAAAAEVLAADGVSAAALTGAVPGLAIRAGNAGVAAAAWPRLMRTDSSPSWISISATPDSSSSSMSFLTLRMSICRGDAF